MPDLSALADPALMARVAGGDERAFGALYDRHATLVYGTVLRFLRDGHATEEIVQDTFLIAWRRSDRYSPEAGSLVGWLLRIARNRAIDQLRSGARRPALVEGPASAGDRGGRGGRQAEIGLAGSVGVMDTDPEIVVARRWAGSVVRTALSAMAEPERQAIELAYDEGLSQAEIAIRLGWPLGTVKSRTRRALAALRLALEGVPGLVDGVATIDGIAGVGAVAGVGAASRPAPGQPIMGSRGSDGAR
jgi:RNA polymerase sigma-70 factor (ECF subfamily)